MNIPDEIIIGENTYKIKMKRTIDWSNSNITGQIDYHRNILTIMKTKVTRAKEDVFFHEFAHGILKELEFNHPKISKFRDNEKFVQEFGLNLRKSFLDLLKKQEEKWQ